MKFWNWLSTKARPQTQTYSHSKATQRFGQAIDTAAIREAVRRIALLNIVTFAITDMALGPGFEVQKKKTGEPAPFQKKLDESNLFNELLIARQAVEAYGAAGFILFGDNDSLAFEPSHVTFEVNEEGDMTKVSCKEEIGGNNPSIFHRLEGEEMNNYFQIVLNRGYKKYEGIPGIEKGWDIAWGFQDILESLMVFCGRRAYGTKTAVAISTGDKPTDDAKKANLKASMANLDSRDNNIILWGTIKDGQLFKEELSIDSGTGSFDYAKNARVFLEAFAGLYSLPLNYLIGVFQGETVGATAVLEMLSVKLKEVQDKWTPHILPIIKRWTEINNESWDEDYTIVSKLKPAIDKNKADTVKVLVDAQIISPTEAREEMGYKGEAPQPTEIDFFGNKPEKKENKDKEDDIDARGTETTEES